MRAKWVKMQKNETLSECKIVTRIINKGQLDVTVGYPGWGLHNKTIAYMSLPKMMTAGATASATAWKSDYRGDSLPPSGWYIVQIQHLLPEPRLDVRELYYDDKMGRWLAVPDGWEVVGWMSFPKPYKTVS